MTDSIDKSISTPHVIRSVSARGYGRTQLVLQSVCAPDGRRYLRAVWQEMGKDKEWRTRLTPPEFNATVWADVIAKAAQSGMLSSKDYKSLLVRLAQGLDSSKSPTPKAYIAFTGILTLEFPESIIDEQAIDEIMVYEALNSPSRDVTVTQSQQKDGRIRLDYVVQEDVHFMEALSRLPDEIREVARKSSLEEAVVADIPTAFVALFGDPLLEDAGFTGPVEADYSLTIV